MLIDAIGLRPIIKYKIYGNTNTGIIVTDILYINVLEVVIENWGARYALLHEGTNAKINVYSLDNFNLITDIRLKVRVIYYFQ